MSSGEEVEEKANVDEKVAEKETPVKKNKDLLKVYVGGLPFDVGKSAVREHFTKCGKIDWLHMPLDSQERPRGIAFISYWDQESVDAALALNGTYFGEHQLRVNMAASKPPPGGWPEAQKIKAPEKKRKDAQAEVAVAPEKSKEQKRTKELKVFIGNIPFACTAETLRKDFEACGAIQQLTMPKGEGGTSKGIAFVTFGSREGVEAALKFHDTEYGGSKLSVRMASEKVEKGNLKGVRRQDGSAAEKNSEANPLEVIVKGLAFGTKETALKEFLADCGPIESVRLPLNKKGKSFGFGFVIFETPKGVKKAVKLSGSTMGDRPCTIERMGEAPASTKRKAPEAEDAQEQVDEADASKTEKAKKEKKEKKRKKLEEEEE